MTELIDILSNCKSKGVIVSIDKTGSNLSIKGNLKGLTDDDKKELIGHKEALIAFFNEQRNSKIVIPKLPSDRTSYKLSANQKSLWVLGQFEEGAVAYNMPATRGFKGDYDIDLFRKAVKAVIDRHEILRTRFQIEESEARQFIVPAEAFEFELGYVDFRLEVNKEGCIEKYISEDAYQVFDLENGPLLRTCLIQTEDDEYVFYYNMHHIISDGWSMNLLAKDVMTFYTAFAENKEPEITPLRIQYKDFAAWQLSQLDKTNVEVHKQYWLDQLSGDIPLIDLPREKNRPALKTFNGRVLTTYISADIFNKVKKLSQSEGGSIFMTLLASWNVLLKRYTNEKDIILGTPIAGREHYELEEQIGFYVNTLALKNRVDTSLNFRSFYQQIKENTLKAFTHQVYPFEQLVRNLDLKRDKSRSAIFDIIFSFKSAQDVSDLFEVSKELEESIEDGGVNPAKFDLDINFQEGADQLYFGVNYNEDVYSKKTIERLMYHFKLLLQHLVEKPEVKMKEICFLSEEEQQEQLELFNKTKVNYPKDESIITVFEQQVKQTPDQIALIFEGASLSYKELNERANQFATSLIERYNVQVGSNVGVKLERSEWLIVAIIAILKTGGTYVPIDPSFPKDRIDFIEKDTQLTLCIDRETLGLIQEDSVIRSVENKAVHRTADAISYIMYTSGSTGIPKGVLIKDRGVVRLVQSQNYVDLSATDRLLSTGAVPFDATTFEYWGMLLNGGQLVLCTKNTLLDSALLQEQIEKHEITKLWLTSGWFNQLVEDRITIFSTLKSLLVGGDLLAPEKINKVRLAYPQLQVINGYGPTENTTFSLTHDIQKEYNSIPIGKPINNSTCYLLDEHNQLVPKGVIGEICVGGDGLSIGYLNNEELTSKVFISHPFLKGEKLYKTGDLGKCLEAGSIEFVGRKDNQVKIRGHRIELGEIEHAICTNNDINTAVVVVAEGSQTEKELIAYYVVDQPLAGAVLRNFLKDFLPAYMVPTYYIELAELPLTPNGKVNRKALPSANETHNFIGTEYVAPTTDEEKTILRIWQEILGHEKIGMKDDFFDLGGHSLKATRVITKIQEIYGVKIDLGSLFDEPTIATLAKHVSTLLWLKSDESHQEEEEEFII